MPFLPRDFIETREGLALAVVAPGVEEGRVRCFLRYVRDGDTWRKLETTAADTLLQLRYPDYIYHSIQLDAPLHAVPLENIRRHLRPRERLGELLDARAEHPLERKLHLLVDLLRCRRISMAEFGVTGSLLLGVHNENSDIDLVSFHRESFKQAQDAIGVAIQQGVLTELTHDDWLEAYGRRGCALDFDTFVWHERRKRNKAMIAGTKIDLALVDASGSVSNPPCRKLGRIALRAKVIDATYAFDQPARYRLDHPEIVEAVSCTHTYVGQAREAEWIEVCGHVEETGDGVQRIVVGSSREAPGEYIRVLREDHAV